MPLFIVKKRYAIFLLPFPAFCLFLGKFFLFFSMIIYFFYFGSDIVSKKIYKRAYEFLSVQSVHVVNNVRKKEYLNEEVVLSDCIMRMKREIFFGENVRKRFRDCLKFANMVEQSYTVTDKKKQQIAHFHELYTYKIRGTLQAIDLLLNKMQENHTGFFCKTIVLAKQNDNIYSVNLVLKEYVGQKK